MSPFRPLGLTCLIPSVVASLFIVGCGGGEDPASQATATNTSTNTVSSTPETVLTTSPDASTVATSDAAVSVSPAVVSTAVGTASSTSTKANQIISPNLIVNPDFSKGATGWSLNFVSTVASELRRGGTALRIIWKASQALSASAVLPHHSYELSVVARGTGSATAAISFRLAGSNQTSRTFSRSITAGPSATYVVDFTAPEYTGNADFSLVSSTGLVLMDSVSLKEITAISQTEPIKSTENSYVPAGYTLKFNDEFNGSALNTSKWFTRYIYASGTLSHLNDEQERYSDNGNQVVENGVLKLVAKKVADNGANGLNYESGMIRSDWTARFGYFEARIKMPKGLGVWPAFWLNSDVSSAGTLHWPPEIDIVEYPINGVEDRATMFHSTVHGDPSATFQWADPTFSTSLSEYYGAADLSADWHTFGCEWTATSVTTYLDGKKLYVRNFAWNYGDGTQAAPAHILLNLAVGGAWAGRHGIDDSAFPQAMQIDWVRAYQKN